MSRLFALILALSFLSTAALAQVGARPEPGSGDVLRADGRVAARLVARPWNAAEPQPTCKIYHHVFAPDGRQLTKGEGGDFQHHRGLFVGWNRTHWNRQKIDFWHMQNGARQQLDGHLPPKELGLGERGQALQILWRTDDAQAVVERRGLEVVAEAADHHVLRMRVELSCAEHPVVLEGDPQHAGQQFRALQQFAEKDSEPVRYVRPEGAEDKGNDVWAGCSWTAAVLPLDDGPVTVLRIEHPDNPGAPTWSTRPYGRFGATRRIELKPDAPAVLEVHYVVALGERDRAWCEATARRWRRPSGGESDENRRDR